MSQARGVEPHVRTYNAMLSVCDANKLWQHAIELLREMVARGVTPDLYSYSAAIGACKVRAAAPSPITARRRRTQRSDALAHVCPARAPCTPPSHQAASVPRRIAGRCYDRGTRHRYT